MTKHQLTTFPVGGDRTWTCLNRLGCFAIVINDPDAVVRVIRSAKALAPEVHILVRTRYLADVEPLELAGADTVTAA